ncbi:beta-ketoacyl-ACP synthase II [Anaerolineales bacterium HSG6]|nr:beta-ketoacyl-ACP synthase II [Anaerolineales bacterium HSG6]
MMLDHKRVVITGLGATTPVGNSVQESWHNLVNGVSGIADLTLFDNTRLPVRFAGEVKNFDPLKYHKRKEVKRMARCSQFAVTTAIQAIEDAGFSYPFDDEQAEHVGVIVGTSMGGFEKAEQGLRDYLLRGLNKVSPFSIPSALPNLSTFHVCIKLNAQGYSNTTATACAAGNIALIEAAEVIRRGQCDIMVAGGTDACITEGTVLGFKIMRALSTRNDDPTQASRPFEAERDGFVMSEGSAMFVLERLSHAQARGAKIYAELLGGALSSDTYHIAAPDPQARGAIRAITWALKNSQVDKADIEYINAHGASTPLGDAAETLAIKTVFGDQAYQIPVSSSKSMIGHAFGGAGAIEALACVKTVETGNIHPTINYHTPDPVCDLDYVPNEARETPVNIAMSNSFGLGGQNACLVLRKFEG